MDTAALALTIALKTVSKAARESVQRLLEARAVLGVVREGGNAEGRHACWCVDRIFGVGCYFIAPFAQRKGAAHWHGTAHGAA